MPNSSDKQLRVLTMVIWGAVGLELVSAGGAGYLLYLGRPTLATTIALLPVAGFILFIVIGLMVS